MPSFWGWALATVSSATRACARDTVGCIAATVQALIKKSERTGRRLRGSVMGTLLKRHIIPMEGERCRNFPPITPHSRSFYLLRRFIAKSRFMGRREVARKVHPSHSLRNRPLFDLLDAF